jgi:hypothetical protein
MYPSISLLTLLSLPHIIPALTLPHSLLATSQTIIQDILNIHAAVLALDETVQAYDGSPFPTSLVAGTPVLLGVARIHEVNRAGFRHAVVAAPFSVGESADVISTVTETGMCVFLPACLLGFSLDVKSGVEVLIGGVVNKSIPAATRRLEAKVGVFKEGLLVPVVVASLALLLADHDTFSAATLAKVSPWVGEAKIREGKDGVANIHDAIQYAILLYMANAI